jgi:hypothetical protein
MFSFTCSCFSYNLVDGYFICEVCQISLWYSNEYPLVASDCGSVQILTFWPLLIIGTHENLAAFDNVCC